MIIFSSDSDFSRLKDVVEHAGYKIDLLVCEGEKPSGRGRKISKNQAQALAEASDIEVISSRLDDPLITKKITEKLSAGSDKIGLVFSFGKIIPDHLIEIFSGKLINLHPSLLPAYRGATPIQSAILNGEKEIGYCLIELESRLDAGDIYYKKSFPLETSDNYDDVINKVFEDFDKEGKKILNAIENGSLKPCKQDEAQATYTKKFSKSDGEILAFDTPLQAMRKINAFSRWPKAYFDLGGTRLIALDAETVDGQLTLKNVQKEGKKPMPFAHFKNGNSGLLTFFPDFVKI